MKQLFLAFLILIAVSSCKKKTTVSIQAQDYITGSGTAYAGQEYAVSESWTPAYETKSKIVSSGFLDQNGFASFDLKMKNNRKYVLGVSQPDNICYGGVVQHYLEHSKSNIVNFDYAKCAFVKLIINNASCTGPNDVFVLYQSNDLEFIGNTTGWTLNGCIYWEEPGGTNGDPIGYSSINYGNFYYKWTVTKNNISTTFYDTVFYAPGEFITYQIDY